jgi:hypothetical protein
MKKKFLILSIIAMPLFALLSLTSCSIALDDTLPNSENIEIFGPTTVNTVNYFEYASSKRQPNWTYNWAINNGAIVDGQGSASVFAQFWHGGTSEIQLTVTDVYGKVVGFTSKNIAVY